MSNYESCPDENCKNTGCIPNQVAEDQWEAQQCEFCWCTPNSIFLALEKLKKLEEEVKTLSEENKELKSDLVAILSPAFK